MFGEAMRLFAIYIFAIACLFSACKQEKADRTPESVQKSADQAPATQETATTTPVKPEPQVTCDSLNIPSYDLWIRDLSSLRCESCHNEKLSFNGVKLLTYEDYQTYKGLAKVRIETNMLTKPLDPIEQAIFLKWFLNDMPRTEKDCANKG
jgi:hypothetical protein